MSVIYGIWSRKREVLEPQWAPMLTEINHWWKPTYTLQQSEKSFFLGGSYIEIEDPKAKKEDLSLHHAHIIADVRLDNRAELAKKIPNLNPNDPDAKYILASYLEYGIDCVHHLIGAFAFSIYDAKTKRFFCATDHVGIKPFHYYSNTEYFVFGTQKKSMASLSFIDKEPNWDFLLERILYYEHQESATEYKHIHRLPPGTFLIIDKDKAPQTKRYWSLDPTKETIYQKEEDYVEHFTELIQEAVKCRMRGASTIGTHLSGGLDSSGITGIAAELAPPLNKEVESFAYTIPKEIEDTGNLPYFNENPYIIKQAEFSKVKQLHRVEKMIKRSKRKVVEMTAQRIDGFSALNKLNTELEMQRYVKNHGVNIVLSGFLGDELITSFARTHYLEYLEKGNYLKYFTSTHKGKYNLMNLLGPLYFKACLKIGIHADRDKAAQAYHQFKYRKNPRKKQWKDNILNESYFPKKYLENVFENNDRSEYLYGFPLTLREYQKNHVHRRITTMRIENENMAGLKFHVQYRYAFADKRLLEYVLSVPVEQKYNKTQNRRLYRRSMKAYIHPEIIVKDNKIGSIKPMTSFYKDETTQSLVRLYHDLNNEGFLPFLDHQKVKSYFENNTLPPFFKEYLIYGVLVQQGKLVL